MSTSRAPAKSESPRDAGQRMVQLVEERGYLAQILGSDPATVERFKTVLLTALTGSPKLLEADPATLVQAMREAAMWDLEPDGIDAVIVPFWNSRRSVYEADFQPTARGYVRVLYRSPKIRFVDADVVYENDVFEYEKGATPRLVHKPRVFGDRGERIGAYALVQLDSGFVRPIVLNEQQIEQRRKVSRESERGPWVEWADEMARKTALRSLMSMVPIARGVKAALATEDAKYAQITAPLEAPALPEPTPLPALRSARQAFLPAPEPVVVEQEEDPWPASSMGALDRTSPTKATTHEAPIPTSQSLSGAASTTGRSPSTAIDDDGATEASTPTDTSGSDYRTDASPRSTESSWSRSSGDHFAPESRPTTGTASEPTTGRRTSSSGSDPLGMDSGRPISSAPTAGKATTRQRAPSAPDAAAVAPDANPETDCGDVAADGLMTGAVCMLEAGHKGAHRSADGSWPR